MELQVSVSRINQVPSLINFSDSSKLHKFYAHRSAVLSIGQPKLHSPPEERHRKANSGVKQTIASHAAKRKVYSLPSNSRTNSRGSIESSVDADDDQQNTQQPFEKLLNSVFSTGADGSLTALSLSPPSVEFTIDSDCITATPVTGLEISRPNFISVSRLSTPLPAETWTVDSDGFVVMSDDSRTKAETPVEASVVFG